MAGDRDERSDSGRPRMISKAPNLTALSMDALRALRETNGDIHKAAFLLSVKPDCLYSRLQRACDALGCLANMEAVRKAEELGLI